ncbi:MAG: hypothetical protein IPN84_01490 [Sphingomonadales bacterium]|jgi:hypothetical protein|nr:hypothetical protein [Sphingomonadales bacterium]
MRILSALALHLLLLAACTDAPSGDGNEAAIAKAAVDLERTTDEQANGIVSEIEAAADKAADRAAAEDAQAAAIETANGSNSHAE